MGAHIAVVIDWYGPYRGIHEARKGAKSDYEEGLYLFIGKQKNQKSAAKLLYVGISGYLSDRLINQHPQLQYIAGEPMIWLGEVATYGIPGRRRDQIIQHAEWTIAYFLELPLNEKKRATHLMWGARLGWFRYFERWKPKDF